MNLAISIDLRNTFGYSDEAYDSTTAVTSV